MLKGEPSGQSRYTARSVSPDVTTLAYWYRHERAARIYDGTDQVHKATLGRRILRRYATPRTDPTRAGGGPILRYRFLDATANVDVTVGGGYRFSELPACDRTGHSSGGRQASR